MTALSQALSAALLHFIWQGTAVAVLLWAALFALRRGSPNARYVASCIALLLMAVLPLATAWVVYRQPAAFSPSVAIGSVIPLALKSIGAQPRAWLDIARQWALPVWAAGVLLFGFRLALGYRHVAVLRRAGDAVEGGALDFVAGLARRMNIARPVRVLASKLADSPCVIGWLRPAILLPAAALANLDARQLEAILAHEMAHICRHDFVVNALQTVVETLLFYHPATWWVSARIREEREFCCDDLAVRHCGDVAGYARALTNLERARVMPEPAVAANGGALFYRIQRLTGAAPECGPSRLPVILAVVAAAVCAPLIVHRVHAQQQAVHEATASGVLVQATLDGDGQVLDAQVVSGPLELRKAALRAVLERRFDNATKGEVRQVNIDFTQASNSSRRTQGDAGGVALTRESTELQRTLEQIRGKLAQVKLPENARQQQEGLQIIESFGEIQLRALEQQLAELSATLTPENVKVRRLESLIETVRKQMARELAGRKLVRIEGEALPSGFQLPVELGDVLTAESMEAVIAGLRDADRSLDAQFLTTNDGGIVIRIMRRWPPR